MKSNLEDVRMASAIAKLVGLHAVKALRISLFVIVGVIFAVGGCRQRMADQPHQRPLDSSTFFPDGMASRPVEPGTVPYSRVEENPYVLTGKMNGKPGDALPFPVTAELLARGQQRYEIFCSPCHDRLGTGQGMIVQRGFRPARSFHEPRLRDAPAGHFFEVMTLGFGPMPSYASQLSPRDRWAVIAYIRALQFSRNARVSELPQQDRDKLKDVQ